MKLFHVTYWVMCFSSFSFLFWLLHNKKFLYTISSVNKQKGTSSIMLTSIPAFDKINFNGGNLSSDGGAILLMEYLRSSELLSQLQSIPFLDPRNNPLFSNSAILSQCICRSILGYHNQSDQKVLIEDPLLSVYTSACSQPTVSRFFDRVQYSSCEALRELITSMACDYVNKNIDNPILDIDSTFVSTNGNQDGAAYIFHYSDVGFHPLCINESNSKLLLSTLLRTGAVYSSYGTIDLLNRVLPFLNNNGNIRLRGDSAFYNTELLQYLEENRITYYIRAKGYNALHKAAEDDLYSKGVEPFTYTQSDPYYGDIEYKVAGKQGRRIVYKAYWVVNEKKEQELIPCIYAVVTNDTESGAKEVMDFYEARGASENFNKEFKNDFDAGTLSHTQFDKNEMEFLISAMAYNLFHIYQAEILENEDQKITMNTYRIRYQKIAVRVIHHARQITLSFSSAYTKQNTFLRYWNKVVLQS